MTADLVHLAQWSPRVRARAAGIQALRLACDLINFTQQEEGLSDEKLAEKSGVSADDIKAMKQLTERIEQGVEPNQLPDIPIDQLTFLMNAMGYKITLSAQPKGPPQNKPDGFHP